MGFPVVMYGCESWTVKKAESQRIDAFEVWCWRRLLRVPWTARRSNQSILKKIIPGISLEGMMLKPMRRVDSLEKTLMLGGIGDRRRRGDRGWDGWMASLTRSAWVWVNSGSWWCGKPGVLRFMGSQRVGHDWATELTDWLMLKLKLQYFGHLIQRADSLKKMLMLGKMEGKRRRGQQSMRGKIQRTRIWENPGR